MSSGAANIDPGNTASPTAQSAARLDVKAQAQQRIADAKQSVGDAARRVRGNPRQAAMIAAGVLLVLVLIRRVRNR